MRKEQYTGIHFCEIYSKWVFHSCGDLIYTARDHKRWLPLCDSGVNVYLYIESDRGISVHSQGGEVAKAVRQSPGSHFCLGQLTCISKCGHITTSSLVSPKDVHNIVQVAKSAPFNGRFLARCGCMVKIAVTYIFFYGVLVYFHSQKTIILMFLLFEMVAGRNRQT